MYKKTKYSYPFGLGTYLMNGCYQFIGMTEYAPNQNKNAAQEAHDPQMDYENPAARKKRYSFQNQTNDMRAFCSRFAVPEPTIECKVIKNFILFLILHSLKRID